MPNVKISDLTLKSSPAGTDEFELQETGGGASKKTTLDDILGALTAARCRVSGAGTLQTGSVGVTSAAKTALGKYDVTLSSAITNASTVQLLAGVVSSSNRIITTKMDTTFTTTIVNVWITDSAGTYYDEDFSFLVLDEG